MRQSGRYDGSVETKSSYTGRLAPSPTGLLHLGHAATFHAAWQRARAAGGTLLLRNEDLDRDRARPEFVTAMLEDLAWLGITWQPPVWTQSERLACYREALERLIEAGAAYPCTCSRRDLRRSVAAPHEDADDEPVYPGTCRALRASRAFRPGVNYRLRVPDGEAIEFLDGSLGSQSYMSGTDPAHADFGDFLLWRKDGVPSYQLACVVDDHAMGITEVVRGRDLLKSTARQILVARALGFSSPRWLHTELLRDGHGVRLAKRHDALAIRTLRDAGISAAEVLALAATPTA